VNLCSTIREDEQHIVFIDGGGQGNLSEESTVVKQHDEHDHEEQHDRHNVKNEPYQRVGQRFKFKFLSWGI